MNKYVIILAAGKGTHMKSINPEYCKVAFPVLGKPMINYVLDTVKKLEPKKDCYCCWFWWRINQTISGRRF